MYKIFCWDSNKSFLFYIIGLHSLDAAYTVIDNLAINNPKLSYYVE